MVTWLKVGAVYASVGKNALGESVAAGEETRLVYFAPEFTETSTIKRVREFLDAGLKPIVVGFERGRYNRHYNPEWPHYLLGRTRDKRYANRLLALLIAIPVLMRIRGDLSKAHIFYARNIDQLVLSLLVSCLFNRRVAIIYEILDIQPVFTGRGPTSRLLRWLERLCLNFVDLLVLSSPAFHRNYYAPVQAYRGDWFLLENKLHTSVGPLQSMQSDARSNAGRDNPRRRPWVVGYFGLIRGRATLELIEKIASQLLGVAEFHFRGVLTTIDERQFQRALARNPNIRYGGEYSNPRDLSEIYGSIDFAWALDLENVEANSRWLMPCRFYEAGAYGIPCLAAADFEVGSRIDQLGIGWTFNEPLDQSLVDFFSVISSEMYDQKKRRLQSLAHETFVTAPGDSSLRRVIEDVLAKTPARREDVARGPVPNYRGRPG